jgi:hypothetical protein
LEKLRHNEMTIYMKLTPRNKICHQCHLKIKLILISYVIDEINWHFQNKRFSFKKWWQFDISILNISTNFT